MFLQFAKTFLIAQWVHHELAAKEADEASVHKARVEQLLLQFSLARADSLAVQPSRDASLHVRATNATCILATHRPLSLLFDKMLRAILSVVKGDSNARGRALKALSLIVDADVTVLTDVCRRCAVL